jgi:Fe-S-cluster-containing dehydrogenase component
VTDLPPPAKKKLGLVIDLDTCVGCHACAVGCKQWNSGGIAGPVTDEQPYGAEPMGVWFNRVHSYELAPSDACGGAPAQPAQTLHFPRSCLHCETPACVTVCPTGASYKRAEDGIVLVDEDKCIGCKLCSWACPYGAREYSEVEGVMKKCTLCVDRIYNENLPEAEREPACVQVCPTRARHFGDLGDPESKVSKLVAERGGVALMPELGYAPVNRYLPPRPRRGGQDDVASEPPAGASNASGIAAWLGRLVKR